MGNSFIFDDEEAEQPEEMGAEPADGGEEPGGDEGGSNRTFLLAVGVLGGVVFIALLCLAVYAGLLLPRQRQAAEAQQAAQLVQNTQIAQAATGTAAAAAGPNYTVQPADTLLSIAARFGISVDDLRNANPGLGDTLTPGQIIFIPGLLGPDYTVQEGDTWLSIAARFGILVDALRNANPGMGDTPTPGVVIVIPGLLGPDYTVQEGDTWLSIAARFGILVDALRNANPGMGDTPTPGQVITIPGVVGLLPSPQATDTPVVVFPTSTLIVVTTVDPITATVAAAYTEAALAQLTVIPTSTALGAVPSTGFADEVGLPMLFVLGAVFLVIIFVVRRVRTAQ